MEATQHASGVYINLDDMTRRAEVHAFALRHGITWSQAIIRLVNRALSYGENPYAAAVNSYVELHDCTWDQGYKAVWGEE